jgi:hypothetical protein
MTSVRLNKSTSTTSLSTNSITSDNRLYTFEEAIQFEKPEENNTVPIVAPSIQQVTSVRHCHPAWTNWNAVWKQEPFEFDLEQTVSQPELEFPEAHCCLYPEFPYASLGAPIINQGNTVVFTGYKISEARYVVEWCERKDIKFIYLRLVGYTIQGEVLPSNHDGFPNIILAVPRNLSSVPFYPLTPLSSIENMDIEEEIEVEAATPAKKIKKFLGRLANGLTKRAVKFFTI